MSSSPFRFLPHLPPCSSSTSRFILCSMEKGLPRDAAAADGWIVATDLCELCEKGGCTYIGTVTKGTHTEHYDATMGVSRGRSLEILWSVWCDNNLARVVPKNLKSKVLNSSGKSSRHSSQNCCMKFFVNSFMAIAAALLLGYLRVWTGSSQSITWKFVEHSLSWETDFVPVRSSHLEEERIRTFGNNYSIFLVILVREFQKKLLHIQMIFLVSRKFYSSFYYHIWSS